MLFLANIQTTIIINAKGKRNKGTIVLLANVHNGITLVKMKMSEAGARVLLLEGPRPLADSSRAV